VALGGSVALGCDGKDCVGAGAELIYMRFSFISEWGSVIGGSNQEGFQNGLQKALRTFEGLFCSGGRMTPGGVLMRVDITLMYLLPYDLSLRFQSYCPAS
jgi:hypothetical protein